MKHKKFIIIAVALLAVAIPLIAVGTYAYFIRKAEVTNTFTVGDVNITLTEPLWEEEIDGKGLMPGTTIEFDPTITETKGESYARIVLEFLDENGSPIQDQTRIQKIRETLCYNSKGDIEAGQPYTFEQIHDKLGNGYCSTLAYSFNKGVINYISFNTSDPTAGALGGGVFGIDEDRSTYGKIVFNACPGVSETSCAPGTGLNHGRGTIFKQGGSIKLFSHIVIPSDWTETDLKVLGNFKLKLTGEAIQSSAFTSSTDAYTALDAAVSE